MAVSREITNGFIALMSRIPWTPVLTQVPVGRSGSSALACPTLGQQCSNLCQQPLRMAHPHKCSWPALPGLTLGSHLKLCSMEFHASCVLAGSVLTAYLLLLKGKVHPAT